ncbi:MAG: BBP7 family outer membrane beta-barrel protein [Planctomycetaceae bacterium]
MFVPHQRIPAALILATILSTTAAGADRSSTPVQSPQPDRAQTQRVYHAGGRKPTIADDPRIFASGPVRVAYRDETAPSATDSAAPKTLLPPRPMSVPPSTRELTPKPAPARPVTPEPNTQHLPVPIDATDVAPDTVYIPSEGRHNSTPDYYYQSTPGYESQLVYTPHYSRREQLPNNWFQAEALLWWTSDVNVPALATVSPVGTPANQAGIVGPDSQVLFGGDILGKAQGGFRVRAGHWMNDCDGSGFVAEFLMLLNRGTDFQISSDGDPIIARPFNNVGGNNGPNGIPDSQFIACPGMSQGSLRINAETRMYGVALHYWGELYDANNCCSSCGESCGEVNGRCCGQREPSMLGLKFGPRFYHLDDDLTMDERFTSTASGNRFVLQDVFDTENSFLGLELGLRGRRDIGRLSFEGGLQLAVGATRQELDVYGYNTVTTPAGATTRSNGGFFAQQSNSGNFDRTRFSLVPGFDVHLGWELKDGWRATLGYNLMLWTNVLRAGEQLDPNISEDFFTPPVNGGVGVNQPAIHFHESNYVAHGLSFGVEKRY